MLKNWTVTFKSLKHKEKGYLTYVKYLNDEKHRNHIGDGHEIVDFGIDYKKVLASNLRILNEANLEKIVENKGGRPSSSLGVSVVINFPYKIEEKEKLKQYTNELIKNYYITICKMNNLQYNKQSYLKYKSLVYANVHLKDTGSKTQINLTLPHYIPNKHIVKPANDGLFTSVEEKYIIKNKKINITEKKYSYLLKNLNNNLALKFLNLDLNKYDVEKANRPKKRQKIGVYKVSKEIEEKQEELKSLDEQIDYKKREKEILNEDIKELEVEENKLREAYEKFTELEFKTKTLETYMSRIEKAKQVNDVEKMKDNIQKASEQVRKIKKYNGIEL